eukprot:gene31573-6765_t
MAYQLGVRRAERDAMTYKEASDYITAEKANQTQFKLAHNNMNAISGNQKDLSEKHQLDISACVTFNDAKLALEEADLTQTEETKPATPNKLRYLETLNVHKLIMKKKTLFWKRRCQRYDQGGGLHIDQT